MLINLVPEFFAAISARDPVDGYRRYLTEHRTLLAAYWHNYILDPDSPHAEEIIVRTARADRRDLREMLSRVNVDKIADETLKACEDTFQIDRPMSVYLMVGVGGANAGELVIHGHGIAFACLEHFTGRANVDTHGLGLSPDLLPLWLAHEIAHVVRYTSPTSRSELARLVFEAGGNYDYWETGSRATLRELLVNEGVAVAASRAIAPGMQPCDYLGYHNPQYRRLRELEAFLRRTLQPELARSGLGYRLRYLSGGTNRSSRTLGGKVIPERAGYYIGHRMVEAYVEENGVADAIRASAEECLEADDRITGAQTA